MRCKDPHSTDCRGSLESGAEKGVALGTVLFLSPGVKGLLPAGTGGEARLSRVVGFLRKFRTP